MTGLNRQEKENTLGPSNFRLSQARTRPFARGAKRHQDTHARLNDLLRERSRRGDEHRRSVSSSTRCLIKLIEERYYPGEKREQS